MENTKYDISYDETKPVDYFNLPCDVIGDTMVNIGYYQVEKGDRFIYDGRDHYYEIRFSSAREDECWIGDSEIAYTIKEAMKIWEIMRRELINERDQKENQKYLTNRMLLVLRRE